MNNPFTEVGRLEGRVDDMDRQISNCVKNWELNDIRSKVRDLENEIRNIQRSMCDLQNDFSELKNNPTSKP